MPHDGTNNVHYNEDWQELNRGIKSDQKMRSGEYTPEEPEIESDVNPIEGDFDNLGGTSTFYPYPYTSPIVGGVSKSSAYYKKSGKNCGCFG